MTSLCKLMCLCSAQLALRVDHESYALIFGFNTFLALIIQTILTLTVADEHGLDLDVRTQVRMVMHWGVNLILTVIIV